METRMTSKKTPEIVNSLFWGTFVLLLGATLLGINLGYLSASIWDSLIKLWPILLIVWGLNIVFRHTYLQVLSYLSPLVLIAAFAYATTMTPVGDDSGKWYAPLLHLGDSHRNIPAAEYKYEFRNLEAMATSVQLTLGGSNIDVSASSEEKFAEVRVTSNVGKPNVEMTLEQDTLKVSGKSAREIGRLVNHRDDWKVRLPVGLPTELKIDAGAADCILDFSKIELTSLTVDTGASDLEVTLQSPPLQGSNIRVDSGASDITIKVPTGTPLKVDVDSAAVSSNFKQAGLSKRDGSWYSMNYSPDKPAIEISIDSGASDVSIQYI